MRICMITSAPFPPQEGIGFYVWNLSKQLIDLGHEVQIITRGNARSTPCVNVNGITIWYSQFLPVYPFHVYLHGMFVDKLLQELDKGIDIFHLHTPLVKVPNTKKPVIVTVHTPMKTDIASVTTDSLLGVLTKLQGPVSYRLEQELFEKANKLTAVASTVADELKAYGIPANQVSVLGNGVDTSVFYPKKGAKNHASPYFLTAGRLGPRKGLEDLIQCAEEVTKQRPDVNFLVAGTGPFEAKLRSIINQKQLQDHVHLLGHISDREELVNLYRGATAYVHAAHYEGLPTVLIEAMACGRPVIATAVSGALDVIKDGQNGLLIPPKEPLKMTDTIFYLLQNQDEASRLGENALETILSRYSWQVVGQNYEQEYKLLLENSPV